MPPRPGRGAAKTRPNLEERDAAEFRPGSIARSDIPAAPRLDRARTPIDKPAAIL
ncbi:hypothetical protein MRA01_55050 [Methylobacterium radiotolerans]|nr:hypothetical protein MRA01_55050 [Methylobacterium radiotolerans]